jgi:hypothetical protein
MEEEKISKEAKELQLHHQLAEAKIQSLPPEQRDQILQLLSLQSAYNSHYLTFVQELKTLEQSYETQYDSIYSQRAEHLKSYKGFWLKVLLNSSLCSSLVYEKDHKVLEYLMDVKCFTDPESDNFAIEFHFDQNPYFENSVLRKKYVMANEDVMEKGIGTDIIWKSAYEQEWKGDDGSFFKYFKTINMPTPAELEGLGEEEEHELVENVEQDYDIGVEFKDEIVPNAILSYFNTDFDSDKD